MKQSQYNLMFLIFFFVTSLCLWKVDNGVSLNEIQKKEIMLIDKMFLHSREWYEKVFMTLNYKGSYELYNNKLGFCSWLIKNVKKK